MTPDPDFGFKHAAAEIIRGIVDTVADLPGLTREQRLLKQQTTVFSVMSFRPRDPLELMLAGQCVIYDAMLRDGARDLLRGQPEEIKLRSRPVNLASGRMFLTTLHTLLRMRDRAADKVATQPAEEPRTAAASSPPASPPAGPSAVRQPPRPSIAATASSHNAACRLPGQPGGNAPERPVTFRSRHLGTVARGAMTTALAPPTGPVISKSHDLAAGKFVTVPTPPDSACAPEPFRQCNQSHAMENKRLAANARVPIEVGGFDGPRMDQQDFHFVTTSDQSPRNHAG